MIQRGATNLVLAFGGGPGAGASGMVGASEPAGGAFAVNLFSPLSQMPGTGGFGNSSAVPAPGGTCGGAGGRLSTRTHGGGPGIAAACIGDRASKISADSSDGNGVDGAFSVVPGDGGNGGGAGSAVSGTTGGDGGPGAGGQVVLWC